MLNIFNRVSFGTKISIIACFLAGSIMLVYFAFILQSTRERAMIDLQDNADLVIRTQSDYLATPMWNFDTNQVEALIQSAMKRKEIDEIVVIDDNGKMVARAGEFDPTHHEGHKHEYLNTFDTDGDSDKGQVHLAGETDEPHKEESYEHLFLSREISYSLGNEQKKIGRIEIVFSDAHLEAEFKKNLIFSSIVFLLLILALSVTITTALRRATKPLGQISEAMIKYAAGERKVNIPIIPTRDEIGNLAGAFTHMKVELDTLYDNLERQVTERTEELEIQKTKAEEATKAKSEFLANMSHEIRTPMNGVIGMTKLLAKSELSEKQKRQVGTILSSANSLLQIINDILDFSKIEAGKLQLENILFSPQQIFDELNDMLEVQLQEKNLYLKFELDASVLDFGIGDPTRVKQIILNLLGNSMKFTEKGGITVRANFINKVLDVSIIDTGIGIKENKLKGIFEKFSQADTSTTRKYGGTGLGLSITYELVTLMGGKIDVKSTYGEGSTFHFFLMLGGNL